MYKTFTYTRLTRVAKANFLVDILHRQDATKTPPPWQLHLFWAACRGSKVVSAFIRGGNGFLEERIYRYLSATCPLTEAAQELTGAVVPAPARVFSEVSFQSLVLFQFYFQRKHTDNKSIYKEKKDIQFQKYWWESKPIWNYVLLELTKTRRVWMTFKINKIWMKIGWKFGWKFYSLLYLFAVC